MGAAGAAVGFVGGIMSGMDEKKRADAARKDWQRAYQYVSPENLQTWSEAVNPWLYNAINADPSTLPGSVHQQQGLDYGQYGGNQLDQMRMGQPMGYQGALNQIVQNPGYIDPTLMNYNLNQSNQMGQQNLQAAQGMLGRSNMQGGLANAYALANQGQTSNRNAGIFQNYALARNQQMRADVDWTTQQQMAAKGMGGQYMGGRANMMMQAPPEGPSWWGIGAKALAGAASGASGGMMGGMQGMSMPSGGGSSPANPTGKPLFQVSDWNTSQYYAPQQFGSPSFGGNPASQMSPYQHSGGNPTGKALFR